MRIRKATQQDLHSIMQLYENARAFANTETPANGGRRILLKT